MVTKANFSKISVPDDFKGNGNTYHPDGYALGLGNRSSLRLAWRKHDYLYSTKSDDKYPDFTKNEVDTMLKEEIQRLGFPQHAEAVYQVLQDVGNYYYKKNPPGDFKKSNVFEHAMSAVDGPHQVKYRTVDIVSLGSVILLGLWAYTKIIKNE